MGCKGVALMSWERGYDVGYYEALRNATATVITLHLNGVSITEIVQQLADLRENAHALVKGDDE